MLVLTRKFGETIVINDNVEVTVLKSSDRQVRLGITAPKDVAVHRLEIYKKIKKEENSHA